MRGRIVMSGPGNHSSVIEQLGVAGGKAQGSRDPLLCFGNFPRLQRGPSQSIRPVNVLSIRILPFRVPVCCIGISVMVGMKNGDLAVIPATVSQAQMSDLL